MDGLQIEPPLLGEQAVIYPISNNILAFQRQQLSGVIKLTKQRHLWPRCSCKEAGRLWETIAAKWEDAAVWRWEVLEGKEAGCKY